jgi:Tol biopolymer transport system component
MAQPFDPGKLELVADPLELASRASFSASGPQLAASVASNGMLIYLAYLHTQNQPTWFDRSRKELEKVGPPGNQGGIALSPDGNSAALAQGEQPGDSAIWLCNLARGSESRLVSVDFRAGMVWSPAGEQIAYAGPSGQPWGLFVKHADGDAEEPLLAPGVNGQARLAVCQNVALARIEP